MALGVNQMYNNYYTIRLGTLSTQHQIQSNRVMLYTNEITDIANRINFFENQKVLTLATPDGSKLAIGAKYFDLPQGFDPDDSSTWGGSDHPYYTTPCESQIFIYKKIDATEAAKYNKTDVNDYYYMGNLQTEKDSNGAISAYYGKIPYTKDASGNYTGGTGNLNGPTDAANIQDSRVLSNKLMTGEYKFVYRNKESGKNEFVGYKDLTFVTESQDKTAYQEAIERLDAQKNNVNNMQVKVEQEMQTTEVEIQAIQSMMESTEKVLQKNTESFKWGA
ncbi:MAG: hypothetical protein PHE78_01330 [Candidatus Gastranaerophilales bacterium]|nr:hypothetical protein [Candidatus Gastranaerophilales bacterium]